MNEAEPLEPFQRFFLVTLLAQVFHCPVANAFGEHFCRELFVSFCYVTYGSFINKTPKATKL